MNQHTEQLNGQFRHLLTIISGFLITKGVMTAEEADFWSALIFLAPGLIFGAVGMVKSWNSKKKTDDTAKLVEEVTERVLTKIEQKKAL